MSIWISKAGLALGASLTLAGCLPVGFGTLPANVSRAMVVSGGAVTVAGPAGYCVDKGPSRDRAEGAFVLFGTCAALSGSAAAGQPDQPALLTASVLPGTSQGALEESFPIMAEFFRSAPGRAALSRTGNAKSVTVKQVVSRNRALYLRVEDKAKSPGQRVEPEYWRAILSVQGRIVTLSALELSDRPLSGTQKRRILESFVARVRAANASGS